ncbi:MAG: outer membrane lipoprotein-sorting protein [Spirochaetaceae bacterium]|nr:MAG: outer membrane lipoprotein-sorting protein [Spirochaetaceae bacterium]
MNTMTTASTATTATTATTVTTATTTTTAMKRDGVRAVPRTGRRTVVCASLLALLWFGPAGTVAAQNRSAEEVMREVDDQRGPDTARSRMTMRIYNSLDAGTHDREIRLLSYSRGITDSLIEFVSPRSITGLRVLDLDGAIRVFFPSTGRVRNIGGAGRSGSVGGVGGDFSYEDMGGSGFMNDYEQFRMEEESDTRWVISAVPRDADSQYSRLVFHVSRDTMVPVRIDYFEKGTQVKRLEASRIQEIGGRNVATHLVMHNMKDNSRTEIRMHEVEWDVPLSDDLFHPNRFHR